MCAACMVFVGVYICVCVCGQIITTIFLLDKSENIRQYEIPVSAPKITDTASLEEDLIIGWFWIFDFGKSFD